MSFATPISCQANAPIMQPGRFVFRDVMRVSAPLVVPMIVAHSITLARAYATRRTNGGDIA